MRVKAEHPFAWLWEPLEGVPRFELRAMFGIKAAYLDGKIVLGFAARSEPWQGVLVATDRAHHAALIAELPELAPHPILPKWLYLPETAAGFETTARRLVALVRKRDPRIGVVPAAKKARRARPGGRPN